MAGSLLWMPVPDDFRITTWLAIGASTYAVATHIFPYRITFLLPLFLLAFRILYTLSSTRRPANTLWGRYTTQIPTTRSDDQAIVVFVLAARINHPMGRFTPGFVDAGKIFFKMWRECGKNRDKYGYLGKTSTLYGTHEEGGFTMVWISYWKTVEGLRDFAASDAHRALQMPFLAKKYPYLGIAHETYHASKGNWETIYHSFQPFGMGKTRFGAGSDGPSEGKDQGTGSGSMQELESPLVKAEGRGMRSMISRMGREEDLVWSTWNPEA